jgi:class 3 adenylate cyclase
MVIFSTEVLPGQGSSGVSFDPFLTGRRLLVTQTFRDLFRTEVIEGSEGIGIREITFLFTDLKGSTAIYERIGDLQAFTLVSQHFDCLARVINRFRGATVKTIGDAVMATFLNPLDAVQAAVGMLREIDEFNRSIRRNEVGLKIGIHRGASIAVTLNNRLDYFGQTVNIAARVQALADAEEIYLTEEAYRHSGLSEALREFDVEPRMARLKGVNDEMQVYRALRRS